jgi:very-short-patch-repair endonuclease
MHNGSQIQDDGRAEDTTQADLGRGSFDCDPRREISYWCNRCDSAIGPRKKSPEKYVSHEQHVLYCWPGGVEGIDYVECVICRFAGCKITQHVKNEHRMSKEEYIEKYGPVICSASTNKYKEQNAYNCDWITRKKEAGEDLSEYKAKMGAAVSSAIMSNDIERARRAELIAGLNKTERFKKKASETAKKTSARPEIQEARTKVLAQWRIDNPEKFQQFVESSLLIQISKPERILHELCEVILGEGVGRQHQIQHQEIPYPSKKARVDISHREKKILVEFDGPFHFLPIHGEEALNTRQARDRAVEKYAVENGYLLIRISYDAFKGKQFEDWSIQQLKEAVNDERRGRVVRIGKYYKN